MTKRDKILILSVTLFITVFLFSSSIGIYTSRYNKGYKDGLRDSPKKEVITKIIREESLLVHNSTSKSYKYVYKDIAGDHLITIYSDLLPDQVGKYVRHLVPETYVLRLIECEFSEKIEIDRD